MFESPEEPQADPGEPTSSGAPDPAADSASSDEPSAPEQPDCREDVLPVDDPAVTDETAAEWAVPGVDRPVAVGPGPVLPGDLVALEAGIDGLLVGLGGLSDEQVLVRTRVLLAAAQRLQVRATVALAETDRRGAYRLEGVASTGRWVASQDLEVDPRQVALARGMSRFPVVAERVGQGMLGVTAARLLQLALGRLAPYLDQPDGLIDGQPGEQALTAVVVDGIRMTVAQGRGGFPAEDDPVLLALLAGLPVIAAPTSRTQLERLEAGLLVLAAHLEVGQLPGALGLLTGALLPSVLQDRAERRHDGRRLSLIRHHDGSGWSLRGELDLECGERLWLLLRAELHRDPDAPLDTAAAERLRGQGLDPYDPDLPSATSPRSTGQKQHDALRHGLARYLAADLAGVSGKDAVRMIVTVPIATLQDRPGGLPAVSGSGSVLPAAQVAAWACDSRLTRHVLTLAGKVIETSHTGRTLTSAERAVVHTQTSGHCQGAGCTRSGHDPGTLLCPHHATPYAHCGTTSVTDTVLLCPSCHHDVHQGHRRLLLKDGRRLGPDGWIE